ncbi:hypothetical protein MRX96_033268 [Rhipicephalus microplus]
MYECIASVTYACTTGDIGCVERLTPVSMLGYYRRAPTSSSTRRSGYVPNEDTAIKRHLGEGSGSGEDRYHNEPEPKFGGPEPRLAPNRDPVGWQDEEAPPAKPKLERGSQLVDNAGKPGTD